MRSATRSLGRLTAVAVVAAMAVLVAAAAPAVADPVGPTDYRTEIVEVDPPSPTIELAILGGDSFVELSAEPGTEVRVTGYRGEPYLWFDREGTVWQNERSPSRWLNDDRFGEAELPDDAESGAEPEWSAVADTGVFAWHDHRAHWMNPARPIGAEPGDIILEAVIPIDVDGEPVAIHVQSELLPSPSPLAAVAGAILALVMGAAALARWQRRRSGSVSVPPAEQPADPAAVLAVAMVWAAAATVLGIAAVAGLPAEAAPGPARWLLPLVAVVVGAGAFYLRRRRRLAAPLAVQLMPAALAIVGLELLLWSWLRRDVLVRALVPSEAPEWIDRAIVAGAAAAGLVALTAATMAVRERPRAPRPTP